MKILIGLTYYRPWTSGLTIYVERLSTALAKRGHHVTILTSQYDPSLPRFETMDGVEVIRVPVALRVSKGVVMPGLGVEATRQVRRHDVLSLHLPQLDAAGIALRGRLFGKPTVLTYHCDLRLPGGIVNRAANAAVSLTNRLSVFLANRIVAYTEDFASHSTLISRYMDKVQVIPPPVEIAPIGSGAVASFREQFGVGKGPVIGMAARLATEKGVEYLLEALPEILDKHPNAQVLFAGQYLDVLGEAEYAARLKPMLEAVKDHWVFLGVLNKAQMTAYYQTCDVTILPSINSTESFGLVQIESMICGTPVVASNLPGVRQPVLTTGMGRVVPVGAAEAIAEAVLEILANPAGYRADPESIRASYASDRTAQAYELLFRQLLHD